MTSFDCEICLRKFKTPYAFRIHMTKHTQEKRTISVKCGTESTKLDPPKIRTTVDDKKPQKCSFCNKMFFDMDRLEKHCRIHNGEKPYVCTTCGSSFNWRCKLVIHERVHTGERPYACKICGKAFSRPYNLKKHERIHTRQESDVCKTRGNPFSGTGILNKDSAGEIYISTISQSESNNKEILHKCETCGKTFCHCFSSVKRHERLPQKAVSDISTLDVEDVRLNYDLDNPDMMDSEDKIYTTLNCAIPFTQSKHLDLQKATQYLQDWNAYDSISFANTDYFGGLNLGRDTMEMFSHAFQADSFNFESDISTVLFPLDSHVDVNEELLPLTFDASTDNVPIMYDDYKLNDLRLMSTEELQNAHIFF